MSQTNTNTEDDNTNQYQDAGRGGQSQGGSCGRCRGDHNGDHGNNTVNNYSFERKLKDGYLSNLTITKSGPRSNQLKKILDALPDLCQDKHYDYINDIISTNTEPTQDYFSSDHLIKTQPSSKH